LRIKTITRTKTPKIPKTPKTINPITKTKT